MPRSPSGPRTPPRPLLAEVAGPADAPVPGADCLRGPVMLPTTPADKVVVGKEFADSPRIHGVPNEPMARRIVPQAGQAGIRPRRRKPLLPAHQARRLRIMSPASVDIDGLPPVHYLILETLAARGSLCRSPPGDRSDQS